MQLGIAENLAVVAEARNQLNAFPEQQIVDLKSPNLPLQTPRQIQGLVLRHAVQSHYRWKLGMHNA